MDAYSHELMAINSANLAANLENVRVNEEILSVENRLTRRSSSCSKEFWRR